SQPGAIDVLLRQFVNNKEENEGVFNKYDNNLLNALRSSIKTKQHKTRNMRMGVAEEDVEVILHNLMSGCFKTANTDETVEEWWRRVSEQSRNSAISLECGFTSQITEQMVPPTAGCSTSTIVKSSTKYLWMMISRRTDLVDCLFIGSDAVVTHLECEPLPDLSDLQEDSTSLYAPRSRCGYHNELESGTGGSIIRWSEVIPGGEFPFQHYLATWSGHHIVDKVMMDILRYGSAIAYLRVPFFQDAHSSLSHISKSELAAQMSDAAMDSLGISMVGFAKGWEAIAKAFKTTITETSRLKVCLGFEKYAHTVKSIIAQGVDKLDFRQVVDYLVEMAEVPNDNELKAFMLLIKVSNNLTWSGESVSYTSMDGFHRFFYFLKYSDVASNTVDFVFGMIKSDFVLAPDVLIVHQKKSFLGGIYETDKTIYRNVPHVITVNGTALLGMYFEAVTYRKLALAARLPVPDFPNLSFLCDRSDM
ncbi:hypothetical protein BGX26_006879, partial [Mortierella sp. AD094]